MTDIPKLDLSDLDPPVSIWRMAAEFVGVLVLAVLCLAWWIILP